MSQAEDQITVFSAKVPETLYQVEPPDCEEHRHFSTLMERLGAIDVFEEWVSLFKSDFTIQF